MNGRRCISSADGDGDPGGQAHRLRARPLWRVAALGLCVGSGSAAAQTFAPTATFVQIGKAEQVDAITAGLAWDWQREWTFGEGRLTGRWEVSVSMWSYAAATGRGNAQLGLIAFTPVLRYVPGGAGAAWFIEGGIGATWMSPQYASDRKTFSTSFNFGDQIAIGWAFGPERLHEISLRYEHYSNADLRRPNPGENFVQLRVSVPFP